MGVVFRRRARAQGSRHRRPRVNRSVDVQGQEGSGEAGSREYHVVLRQEIISIEILLNSLETKQITRMLWWMPRIRYQYIHER